MLDNLPDSHITDLSIFPVQDQGNTPSCVAHSMVTIMQHHWYEKTGKVINFSPRFLDIVSWTDDLDLHSGRSPITVMHLACKIGCCTEDLLPNDTNLSLEAYRDKSLITQEMLDEAYTYRLSSLGLKPKVL